MKKNGLAISPPQGNRGGWGVFSMCVVCASVVCVCVSSLSPSALGITLRALQHGWQVLNHSAIFSTLKTSLKWRSLLLSIEILLWHVVILTPWVGSDTSHK